MAENLDDGEFWLPPQFLTDDDSPKSNNNNNLKAKNDDVFHSTLRSLFPYRLSSPVESLVGSSETESSDEEEHMAELTRRMTHQLDLNCSKGMVVSGGSPPKSPNSVCQMNSQSAAWDLLHAAAGEVEKMRLLVLPPVTQTKPGVGFYTQNALSHQQLQIAQFQMLREQQMVKQQEGLEWGYLQRQSNTQMGGNRVRNSDVTNGGRKIGANMGLSPSAWPHVQQAKQQFQYVCGNGMRGVFSGKRGSTGTGVFLPRSVADCSAKSRIKPACPNVLVSTKVVQHALDLKQQQRQARFDDAKKMDYASAFPRIQSNYGYSQQQKRNIRPQPPVNHEIQLPQEWTY